MPDLPAPPLPTACLNCGQPFAEPRPKFCPACSQETNVKPPTVGEFMQQFGGAYFATEGAFWRTLKLLLFKPGELTRQYLLGRRKHYVLPLRLYLSITLVMLLMVRVSGAFNFATMDDPDVADALPERPRSVQLELGFGRAGLDEGVFYCQGLAPWACKRLQRRLDVNTRALVEQMRLVNDRVASNAGAMMIVLMPAFALGLTLLWRNRGLRYTEHLVFALHLHAFWSLVVAGMVFDVPAVQVAALVLMPVYALLAARRVYGGRWWPLLLRFAVLITAHVALIALTTVTILLAAMLV